MQWFSERNVHAFQQFSLKLDLHSMAMILDYSSRDFLALEGSLEFTVNNPTTCLS